MLLRVIFLILLIFVNGFFAASEMALISVNDARIKHMVEGGHKKAQELTLLLKEPSQFLATIQIGITLAGYLASALAAESFADPIVNSLISFNLPVQAGLLKTIVIAIITIILSYFSLVFGELVPKRIAMNRANQIAFSVVSPLSVLSKITKPMVQFLTFSTNAVVKLIGIESDSSQEEVTEEEIRMLIDVGQEKGTVNLQEKKMIHNVFEFNDKTAGDIMTHRVELMAVSKDITLTELMDQYNQSFYSRIPVYETNLDNIIGIMNMKDLLPFISDQKVESFQVEKYMRKPIFVSLRKKINQIFIELQASQNQMVIVLDDYGGTAGIITMEDLIEEIVGNIYDEYDGEQAHEIKKIDADTWVANGNISLLDLEKVIHKKLPTKEFDTLNGLLLYLYHGLPGETSVPKTYQHVTFEVLEITDKKINKVKIYLSDE